MAAVIDGTQVVVLLHRIFLAIERSDDDAVAGDRIGHAAGFLPQGFVSIVSAGAHPVFLSLSGELVLQFDVVEAGEVDIETINAYRHIPCLALAVVWAFGVDYPMVARRADVHLAGRRDEMGRELGGEDAVGIFGIVKTDGQVLIVICCAGIDRHFLGDHIVLSVASNDRIENDVFAAAAQWLPVDTDRGSFRVAAGKQVVVECQ